MIQVRGWVGWAGAYNKGWVGKVTTIQARGGGRGTRTIQGWCQDKKKSGGPGEPHEGKVREHLIKGSLDEKLPSYELLKMLKETNQ